jgi:predicted amidohydrolase
MLNARIGLLICADVLYPHTFDNIKGLRPEIIIVPTTSPYRENETAKVKFERDRRLFARGAEITGAVIFKVCASGNIGKRRFQARSLIAAPDGIAWRNPPPDEDKSMLIFAHLRKISDDTRLDINVLRP